MTTVGIDPGKTGAIAAVTGERLLCPQHHPHPPEGSRMTTVGIDPGKTGAIAAVTGERLLWVADMPVAGEQIAIALLDQFYDVDEYGPWSLSPEMPVAIEHVHSMSRQGVTSTFNFGKSYGIVLGWFTARGHRITHVVPKEWKSTFRLNGKDKDAARLLAIELWPAQANLFARKKDCGRADAALIALHHSRTAHHLRMQELMAERAALRGKDVA